MELQGATCARSFKTIFLNNIKMSTESEQILAEAVRKYPALYDKQDKYFKDKNKKRLAWADVAKEANLQNGEIFFLHKSCSVVFCFYECQINSSFFISS